MVRLLPCLGWTLALSLVACGGPLDRRDGALVIRMTGVPEAVTRLELTLHAGGRAFDLALVRPLDDVVDELTAVPAGAARLDLSLFAGDELVAALVGLAVVIDEDATREVVTAFGDGPKLQVELRGASSRPVWEGPVFVDVRDRTATPPAEIELSVWVDGVHVVAPPLADGAWVVQVDPVALGALLPRTVLVEVEACFIGLAGACARGGVEVELHRRLWRTTARGRPAGAGWWWGTSRATCTCCRWPPGRRCSPPCRWARSSPARRRGRGRWWRSRTGPGRCTASP